MDAITTRNLTRHFGKLTAVDDLNLNIPASTLFGLIGPNGAGKTTTLRMLAGLLEPSSGRIRINQLLVNQYMDELRWQIGYMPDFFGVYEELLVWEYLDFYCRCFGIQSKQRKGVISDLLDLVDLTNKRDAYVHTLSRGMRQRLCLAHCLVHDPKILLLDEPASGLDPRSRVEMQELMRELRSLGKTIILSTHILSELTDLCDSIGIMEKGKLVASGTIASIHDRLQPTKSFRIKILSDVQDATVYLDDHPNVRDYSISGQSIDISFSGDDQDVANLMEDMLGHQIRMSAFNQLSMDLEDIYLQLTSGESS